MDFPDLTTVDAKEQPPVPDLTAPGAPPPMSDDTIEAKARRADMAMGDKSPGVQPLKDQFNSNGEAGIRSQVAGQATVELQQAKLNKIREISQQTEPITGDQLQVLMSVGKAPGMDPSTSIEERFGQNYVGAAVAGDPSKNLVFQSAFEKMPDETNKQIQVAQGVTGRAMTVKNFRENQEALYNQLPWVNTDPNMRDQEDKLGNLFKNTLSLGFREYVQQRNLLTGDTANTSLLPGTNKLEQVQAFYLLPPEELLPALERTLGPNSELWKTNPSAAMDMIRAVESFGTSDAYVDNVFALGNVASLVPGGSIAKAIGRLVKGREVPSLALQTGLQAAEDVLRSSAVPPRTPLSEAGKAAQGAAEDILKGSPTPPKQGYYVPGAAIEKRDHIGSTKDSGASVLPDLNYTVDQKTGEPTVYNADGVPIQLSRTPEVGHYPITTERQPETHTYTNASGTHVFTQEAQDYSAKLGAAQPANRTLVGERPTIFVDKKGYETLSQALDPDKPGNIMEHATDPNKYYVVNEKGKRVTNSTVTVSHEPGVGKYPIHVPEGNDKLAFEDFGSAITRVEKNQNFKVNFGTKIAAKEDVETRKALSDIVKSVAESEPQDALSKMGQHEAASQVGATRELTRAINQQVPATVEDIRRLLPSIYSPQAWFHNASSLSRDVAERIQQGVLQANRQIAEALANPVRVNDLTQAALDAEVERTKGVVRNDPRWNRNADAIRDQEHHWNAQTNTWRVETKFGKKDGTLFDTSAQAEAHKAEYKLGDAATVEQEGNQFYLSHMQDIDATSRTARDRLIVAGNETPHGTINTILGVITGKIGGLGASLRSSRYTLSEFQSAARNTATHASSTMQELLNTVGQPLVKMTKAERQELEQVLTHNRDFMHSDGTRGMFYNTAGDFEQGFFDIHHKMPTSNQLAAYDTFIRLNDLDFMLRAFQLHRDRARQGIRNFQVDIPVEANGLTSTHSTEYFNGKRVEDFGPTKQDANVYVIPQKRMTTKFGEDTPNKRELNAKIASGEWQVIQVANPREKPLMAATGYKDDIHFIVTDAYKDKALTIGEGLNYNAGGHVINRDPYFLKVPVVGPGHNGKLTHFADSTVKSFATEREANMWADRYNEAREHLANNREPELQAMFDKGMFPETLPEFKKLYTGAGPNGGLDAKMPFTVTQDARTTFQSSKALRDQYPGLAEQWSSYNLSQSYNKDFLAERDMVLNTISGKEGQWENTASRLYDPYTSLQRGLQQITRERWMGDAKTTAAESWIQEFGHLFPQDTLPKEKLEQNPWYWVMHAPGNLDAGLAKTNPELYTAAMVSRQNIVSFLGVQNEISSVINGLERKMIDWLEPKIGTRAAGNLEEHILPFIKDVPTYIRRAAFHAVDGLFNPVQLIQQAQDIGRVIAISPNNGLHGATAGALGRFYRTTDDPAILASMLDKAEGLGWDRAEFKEAFDYWKASGVHNIGGEVSALNDLSKNSLQIFSSKLGRFVDKGLIFFKKGEQITRDTAFFTAYRDIKQGLEGRAMTNADVTNVINRMDTLTGNMTRASNASYNEGVLSIPTQFWNWNARFTEQMLGKQLTGAEKARVLTAYSALYGIPATLGGVGFGVIPYANYDDIKQYAMANGYNLSSKYAEALMNGIPEMLTNMITGHHTDFKRFSPDANQLRDILDGKKQGWQAVLGASGGFLGNVGNAVYPFARFAMSAIQGRPGDYPVKWNDVTNMAELVSSFNNGEKALIAYNTGKLWSKNDQLIDSDVDKFEAFALALGLNPQRVSDAFLKKDYLKKLGDLQEKMKPMILQQWGNGYEAAASGDINKATEYFTRAKTLAGAADVSLQDQAQMMQNAVRGSQTDLVDSAERQWQEKLPQFRNNATIQEYLKNLKLHQR